MTIVMWSCKGRDGVGVEWEKEKKILVEEIEHARGNSRKRTCKSIWEDWQK